MSRVAWGFTVSVLGLPVLVFVLSGFQPGALVVGYFVVHFTGAATLFVGAPLYFWCCDRGYLSAWIFVAGGASAGVLVCLPLMLMLGWEPALATTFAIIGAIHGTIFWVVAIWRNLELKLEAISLKSMESPS